MTIEYWPKRCLTNTPKPAPKVPRRQMPMLPMPAGKAHQKLSQAIICGDDFLASWLHGAVKRDLITGDPGAIKHLRERLEAVIVPLDPSPGL